MKTLTLVIPAAVAVAFMSASIAGAQRSLDEATVRTTLNAAADIIEKRYVYPEKAKQIAAALREDAAKTDRKTLDPKAFANELTERLRELSNDGHFGVDLSAEEVVAKEDSFAKAYDNAEIERRMGAGVNYGVQEIRRLEGGIGYIDLRTFAPPALGGDVIAAAMTVLAQSEALIIDLRRNGGGDGDMTHLLASYLFDRPVQMSSVYNRPTDKTTVGVTQAWVPGRRLGGVKPVFILISKATFSAAEAFTYDLQAMHRATVVGETSGGGAHPFAHRRIGAHFVLRLPEMRVINPITGTDWEGVGVIPDVIIPEDQALSKAIELAQAQLTIRTGAVERQ
jgi:C-terminal processing protease CtpA/Prc